MKIKVCGITGPEDAELAIAAGADLIGINFAPASKRRVTAAAAAEIAAVAAGRALRVGLFVDASRTEVAAVLEQVPLDGLQFQGDEPATFCAGFGLPYMKGHRVRPGFDLAAVAADYPDACAHLLDAWVEGEAGGTGHTFDWNLWPAKSEIPLVLAGGLTADNVVEAILRTRPSAVDVCSGVEGPVKGRKDPDRLTRFIAAARRAEAEVEKQVS